MARDSPASSPATTSHVTIPIARCRQAPASWSSSSPSPTQPKPDSTTTTFQGSRRITPGTLLPGDAGRERSLEALAHGDVLDALERVGEEALHDQPRGVRAGEP